MKTIWPDGLTGVELFKFLVANKQAIFDMKKSVTKVADISINIPKRSATTANKAYAYSNDEANGTLIRTIVMNTYNWIDSHDDAHQDNLFAKSLQERGDRIPHLHDHIFELSAKVGVPISWKEANIAWSELGVDMAGDTMSLLVESEIRKSMNKSIYKAYLNDEVDQHSVKMQYVELALALNDADYADEYKTWKATYDKLGNKPVADKQGYYFAIKQAKLFEGSAVLLGSNELTPTLNNKFEPLKDTQPKPQLVALDIEKLVSVYMSN